MLSYGPPTFFFLLLFPLYELKRWKKIEKQTRRGGFFSPESLPFHKAAYPSEMQEYLGSPFNLEFLFLSRLSEDDVAFPLYLLVESGFCCIWQYSFVWLETTKQFSASAPHHSLIFSPSDSFRVYTPHTTDPP